MQQHSPPSPRAATMASSDQLVSLSSSVSTLTSNVSTAATEETVVASEEDRGLTPPSSRNNINGSNTSLATSVSVSTNATITNSSSSSHQYAMPEDVVKSGYMRKLKTNRRKFFVLRRNHMVEKGHATLSYYDNEKKFRANPESNSQLPRRTTMLKHCWNVHRKFDKTHRPVMAIYTREDMLATICDDEFALAEWITAIRSILAQMSQFLSRPFREFDNIWQVNINRAGLGLSRNITGLHRITLASNVLYIYRVDPSVDNPDIYEFPLTSVRKCGHNSSTFFLELGRSALVGAGDLWMQTEDQAMASHMHEVVLNTMTYGRKRNGQNEESAASVPVLPRSNSTSSNHRPRSSSNSTEVGKSTQPPHNGSTQSISSVASVARSGSHSRRNSKQLQSPPQLPSSAITPTITSVGSAQQNAQTVASVLANGNDGHGHVVPLHFSSGHLHHFHHGTTHNHHHMYHYGHGRNGVPNSVQSPATSRERLHSGSWSRTTSECSNEDGSSGASSNAATTPVGQTNILCESCLTNVSASNMHIWSANNNCPCPCLIQHSNMSLDYHSSTNGNNSSTHSSMDCIDSMFVSDHVDYHGGMPPTGGVLTLEPPISEEADGFSSDDYYQMMVPNSNENSKSNSNQSISSMTSSKSAAAHGHHPNQVYCVHLPHLQPIRSNSLSASDRRHTSPITSPKCSCSGCQQHYSNGGFFTLPTVPAGTDADYVPMTPLSQQPGNAEGTNQTITATKGGNTVADLTAAATPNCENSQKQDANNKLMEENSYLNMAPMSPEAKSSSSSSMSNATANTTSSEFRLEKVRSYYGDQGCIVGNAIAHHHQPTPVALCGHQASLDDSIFNGLTRAYSTGSRPQPLAPSIAAQCTVAPKMTQPPPTSQSSRTRAYSTGSHGLSLNAFRMKSRRLGKQHQAQQLASTTSFEGETIASSSSSSSLAEIEASNLARNSDSAKNNKASSAPILSPLFQQRTRSATLGSRPTPANQHMIQNAGKMSHPHLASVNQGYELESDMMEIDYSRKSRSRTSHMGNSDIILSSFEEELIREAKKAPSRSRLNSTSGLCGSEAVFAVLKSGGSTSLDGSTALQPGLTNGRKRSDSTSAISNFFGPHRPHGHHVTFRTGSTFDHLVASFRHSLNIQPSTSAALTSEGSSKATNSSIEIDEEECYMMTSPTGGHDRSTPLSSTPTSKKSSESLSSAPNSTPVKSESKGLAASLTSIIRKSSKVSSTEKLRQPTPALEMTVLSAPQEYTVMSPLGSTVATKSPETTTAHKETAMTNESMEVDVLSKKLEEKTKQQAEAPIYSSRYNDSDEEASPYVMMTPLETTSGRKSAPSSSSNSQKKQKTSTMRSLINSLGSKSSASSNSSADQANNTPRKKSSTFSGLLLSRSNSNHSESKRKKNSKSESSSTLPAPPNCSADHAVTNGTVTTMSALAS